MSYEGREQHICAAGHLYESNASFYNEDMPACSCGQKSAWHNSVDDTNCDSYGYIPLPFFTMLTPEESQVCNLGHKHITKMATYQIPSQDDVPKIRHYWDDVKGAFVPIRLAHENFLEQKSNK